MNTVNDRKHCGAWRAVWARPLQAVKAGFTLVELLVSITILSAILLSLAAMMGFVESVWSNGIATVDNFKLARVTLSLLDRDIQMMVMRRDLAAFVDQTGSKVDTSGNSVCAFYTNVQGSPGTDTRSVSLVQYQIPTQTPTSSVLQRLNYGMNYVTSGGIAPTVGNSTSLSQIINFGASNTDLVSTGVIAFEIQFVDGTGTIQPTFNFAYTQPLPASNSRSVIVSMVVISNAAYNLAKQQNILGPASTAGTVSSFFSTTAPTTPYQTFNQAWSAALNTPSTAFLKLPAPIRSGMQVIQRQIPLPIITPTS